MAQTCVSCDSTDFETEGRERVCSKCGHIQDDEGAGEDSPGKEDELNKRVPDKEGASSEEASDKEDASDKGNASDKEDASSEEESDIEAAPKRASLLDDSSSEEDEPSGRKSVDENNPSDNKDAPEDEDSSAEDDKPGKDDSSSGKDSSGEDDEAEKDDEQQEQDSPGEVDSSDDEDRLKAAPADQMVYDFDIMMAKKKAENSRKRRRRGYDIINDNDDIIADIINQMKDAVEADIDANKNKQVATSKLKLLPFVINQLRKVDLRDAFLDSDILGVMTEWLAPLPDRSLPHLNIRENLLKILLDFNLYDVDRIKNSGIGKAVMYLYKHPRETRENKNRCKQLISAWSRPIFNLDSSFSAISKEEREDRDKELKRRASRVMDSSDGEGPSQNAKRVKEAEPQPAKKPGDEGWIPRARVPAPSMRDYVIRPQSKVDGDIGKGSKRPANMLEKLMKTHSERRRANKQQRAINMKIDKL